MLYRTIWDRNWYIAPYNEGGCLCIRAVPEDRNRLILMQYADLTDKDGKPLDWWEGDVLEDTAGTLFEIVKEQGCFWAKTIGTTWMFALYSLVGDNVVVRGNRHENPELLEGKV